MTLQTFLRQVIAALLSVSCLVETSAASSPKVPSIDRILFVGNSLTFYNGGLDNHVRLLAESAHPPRILYADQATKGGATLRSLQSQKWVHEKIQKGNYDRVILQDDIPEFKEHRIEPFSEQVRQFDREIRKVGAKPILFMAWPYERLGWVTLEEIAKAHRLIGAELGIPVAPVGLAFQRSRELRLSLSLLGTDKEHETLHGTYLAASVVYYVLFGVSPEGLSYHPTGISAEEATFLQKMASMTVREWQK